MSTRVIIISIWAFLIAGQTYAMQYSFGILNDLFLDLLIVAGFVLLPIALWFDWKKNRLKIKVSHSTVIGIIGILISSGFYSFHQHTLEKPSILKAYYNGDYNGTSLDLKQDGTYILDNFCLGSNYYYGNYSINGNEVKLDRDYIDGVIKSKTLEIDTTKNQLGYYYLYQVNEIGEKLPKATSFRVVNDNR